MWKVEYTKRFLKELSKIPSVVRVRIEEVVFRELICENPFSLSFLRRLSGYKDKYKIRIGDYRIGLTIDKMNKRIICQRVAHRKDIYKIYP